MVQYNANHEGITLTLKSRRALDSQSRIETNKKVEALGEREWRGPFVCATLFECHTPSPTATTNLEERKATKKTNRRKRREKTIVYTSSLFRY